MFDSRAKDRAAGNAISQVEAIWRTHTRAVVARTTVASDCAALRRYSANTAWPQLLL